MRQQPAIPLPVPTASKLCGVSNEPGRLDSRRGSLRLTIDLFVGLNQCGRHGLPTADLLSNALEGQNALDGKLNRRTDGGTTWTPSGDIPGGQPQALTAVTPSHIIAAAQNGIYKTKDGG